MSSTPKFIIEAKFYAHCEGSHVKEGSELVRKVMYSILTKTLLSQNSTVDVVKKVATFRLSDEQIALIKRTREVANRIDSLYAQATSLNEEIQNLAKDISANIEM